MAENQTNRVQSGGLFILTPEFHGPSGTAPGGGAFARVWRGAFQSGRLTKATFGVRDEAVVVERAAEVLGRTGHRRRGRRRGWPVHRVHT